MEKNELYLKIVKQAEELAEKEINERQDPYHPFSPEIRFRVYTQKFLNCLCNEIQIKKEV